MCTERHIAQLVERSANMQQAWSLNPANDHLVMGPFIWSDLGLRVPLTVKVITDMSLPLGLRSSNFHTLTQNSQRLKKVQSRKQHRPFSLRNWRASLVYDLSFQTKETTLSSEVSVKKIMFSENIEQYSPKQTLQKKIILCTQI